MFPRAKTDMHTAIWLFGSPTVLDGEEARHGCDCVDSAQVVAASQEIVLKRMTFDILKGSLIQN